MKQQDSVQILKEKLSQSIYGLSDKKALPIAEYVLFSSLAMMRGRNKNPIIHDAGSISTKYVQETFKIGHGLCAKILDFCFDRGEEYRTGACKPSKPKGWIRELTLDYVSEKQNPNQNLLLSTNNFVVFPTQGNFYIEFQLPIENLKEAMKQAKLLSNEDEYHTYGPDEGKLKNNRDEYKLAEIYLAAGLSRNGYFCERYEYKNCGRIYQPGYGFQNMKKVIRNLAFKGFYNVDINSSFFRMAHDLYHDQWGEELKSIISDLLDNKDDFYSKVKDAKEFKINLLSILLGCNNFDIIHSSPLISKLNQLLNDWMTAPKRRKTLANDLFHKEQEYVQNIIQQIQEIPHVLIHDGFIVQNHYQLDEKIWSVKQL